MWAWGEILPTPRAFVKCDVAHHVTERGSRHERAHPWRALRRVNRKKKLDDL